MIWRLPDNILYKHAHNLFSSRTISKHSWFYQIREYCILYGLPHPLNLLSSPLPKLGFKKLVKKKVIDYWEQILRAEASPLPSLIYFKPFFMSLTKIHPIWLTAGCSPSKVSMAVIQASMLSGRYRTEYLCRHWSKNKEGVCLLSPHCSSTTEDLPHILAFCPALTRIKRKVGKLHHQLL